jgi:YidC/Oxa1 family membrane protein insertase
MDENNRNFLLAIVLSIGVLFAWQVFFVPRPHPGEQKSPADQTQVQPGPAGPSRPGTQTPPIAGGTQPGRAATALLTREEALAASPRIAIDTPSLKGSIALKGGRIDDLMLMDYRETVDPGSPHVVLLSPAGGPLPYYTEYGWAGADKDLSLPTANTLWTAANSGALTPQSPVTLTYDNGKGLKFTRTITVDDKYMFTVTDAVTNAGADPVAISPYGLVYREQIPPKTSYWILHEGLIGVADQGVSWCGTFVPSALCQTPYKKAMALNGTQMKFTSKSGWLGITDKYWATVLVPPQDKGFNAQFTGTTLGDQGQFWTDFVMSPLEVAPGATAESKNQLFAGAKEVHLVDAYAKSNNIPKFDLLIDWGWFYFLTRPMFYALDFFYKLVGNFGIAILIVTLCIKLVLFPLANKSYVSMSKMKKLGPEMQRIKVRYGEDRVRQQQAMMELYKKEKVNPASGCLPILVQIPVFFSLYKVLFVTIEMRHAPFFGWIRDLSAPDPTSVFNLFGLLPYDPSQVPMIGHFLAIGAWPLIMGVTMWAQMKLNPAPPDPVQQKVFAWMPVFFTFLLAGFPAGLVIYWAWNNTLSVIQQSVIMSRQGVEIPLLENLGIKRGAKSAASTVEGGLKKSKRQAKNAKGEAQKAKSESESAESEPKS